MSIHRVPAGAQKASSHQIRGRLKQAFALLLACLALVSLPPARAGEVSQGWRQAALFVPGSAMPLSMERDADGLLFTFQDERRELRYLVHTSADGLRFLGRTMSAYTRQGAPRVTLGARDIKDQIADKYPLTDIEGVFTSGHDGLYTMLAVYRDEDRGYFYRDFYHAGDGSLLRSEMKPFDSGMEGLLSYKEARAAALSALPGAILLDISLVQAGES